MRYEVLTFFCSCLRKGTSPFFLTSSVCTIWTFHCVSHLEDACQSKEQKWTLNIDHYSPAPHQQRNRPDIHLMSTVILCNSHKKHSSEKKIAWEYFYGFMEYSLWPCSEILHEPILSYHLHNAQTWARKSMWERGRYRERRWKEGNSTGPALLKHADGSYKEIWWFTGQGTRSHHCLPCKTFSGSISRTKTHSLMLLHCLLSSRISAMYIVPSTEYA